MRSFSPLPLNSSIMLERPDAANSRFVTGKCQTVDQYCHYRDCDHVDVGGLSVERVYGDPFFTYPQTLTPAFE